MKSIRFIIALLCAIGACPKSAQSTEMDDLFDGSYIPEVYEHTGRSVSWLEHGKLYHHISTKTGMHFFRYVKENSAEELYTDGSLASVSEILANESIQNSNDEMIRNIIDHFFFMAMSARGDHVLDKRYLDAYRGEVEFSKLPKEHLKTLFSLLEKNGNEGIRINRTDNKWIAEFYVITPSGGIELYRVYGTTGPVNIYRFDREIIYKNGTFETVVFFGEAAGL
jgi:hypothetical protein